MADPIFWFDPSTGIFYTNDGEKVPLRVVAGLSSDSIDASVSAMSDMATLIDSGDLTATAWHELMQEEIKQEYIRQYLLGHGGRPGDMTHADWGRIGSMIKEQYKYLTGFADEVASGNLTLEQIQARAGMYCNSAREAFEKSRGRVMTDVGMDEEKWLIGVVRTEHCGDCLGYAAQDWQSLGTFPFPGDGNTQCLTNCGCTKIYRNSQTGYEEDVE